MARSSSKSTARKSPGSWGTTQQLPSGKWRAFYREEGERFTAPRTFATKADAQAWLAGERADRDRGTWRDPRQGQVHFGDYARAWLAARPDLAPRTLDLYQRQLDRWILPKLEPSTGKAVELGARTIAELTPAVVRAWFAAVSCVARDRSSVRSVKQQLRAGHPARAWAKVQGIPVGDTGRLSPEVLRRWRAAGAPSTVATDELEAVPTSSDAGHSVASPAYRLLRTILNTALQDKLIHENPCQIKGAGTVKHAERRPATPGEVEALAAAVPPRLRAAVLMAAWSGLRYGEQFALARRHVDLEAGTVRVERALVCVPGQPVRFGPPKTDRSRRLVHLPAVVVTALRAHLEQFAADGPDALVFARADGRPVLGATLSVAMRGARVEIGREDLRWHDLRHTGATLAYTAGASLPEVQARLGHTTMRAASIYAHAAADSDRVLASRLDALITELDARPKLRAVGS